MAHRFMRLCPARIVAASQLLLFPVLFILLPMLSLGLGSVGAEEGLVAHWDFNQGAGAALKDVSGNGNDGRIRNAEWIKIADGCALNFKGAQSYVDFGDNRNLKRAGDVTALAWVKVADPGFPSDRTNYHVVDCSSYRHSGFRLLVVGSGKLAYESNREGNPQGAHSQRAIEAGGFYHVAFAKKGDTVSFFLDGMSDIQFKVSEPLIGPVPFKISTEEQSFHGLIDDVKMYSRAFSPGEVAAEFARGAAEHGKDAAWVGKILLKPYFYFPDKKAVIEANFSGILPLQEGENIAVELARRGGGHEKGGNRPGHGPHGLRFQSVEVVGGRL
ncbi:MAG: hypothetical protein HY360_26125 [Verrucomicrobia bacterium]|nr:hypothetical protein [Verrucomicrobiota bacterium]